MAFVDTGITEPDFQQGHRVLDAASVWLREASRDGKRAIDRKSMSSTYGGSLSARALNKMSDPAQKIVVSAGGLSARDSWRLAKEPVPKQGGLLLPLTADERKLQDLVQSMASKAALRFASISDVFRGLDPDRDGKIDRSELRYFFRTCGQTDAVADMFWKHLGAAETCDLLDYDLLVSFMRPFLVAAYQGVGPRRDLTVEKETKQERTEQLDSVKVEFAELLAAIKNKARGFMQPKKAYRCLGTPGKDRITKNENRAFFRCFNLAGEQAEAFYDRLAEVGSGEVSHSLFTEALNDCFVREPDYGSFRIPKKKELPQAPALDEVDEEAPEEPAWRRLRTYQPAEETLFSFKQTVDRKLLKELREVMRDIGHKVRMSYKRPRDALRPLDLQKDGIIRKEEMRDFFRGFNKSESFADQVFTLLDPSGTGKVDFSEFLMHFDEVLTPAHRQVERAPVIGLADLGRSMQAATVVNAMGHRMLTKYANARQAFRDLDLDKDGKVSRKELQFFVKKMGLPVEAADVLFEALTPSDFGGLIDQDTFVSLFLDLKGDLNTSSKTSLRLPKLP